MSDFGQQEFVTLAQRVRNEGSQLSNQQQLELYGLYKQATVGPCTDPQPSIFAGMAARAKWAAWQEVQELPQAEARLRYTSRAISLLDGTSNTQTPSTHHSITGFGPIFSMPGATAAEGVGAEDIGDGATLRAAAQSGNCEEIETIMGSSDSFASILDSTDPEGRTALHWAVDGGHAGAVRLLLAARAGVNCRDGDGQTPLHYATLCERQEIATLLLDAGADPSAEDCDGETPMQLKPESWDWGR